jgi:hypothetical protein
MFVATVWCQHQVSLVCDAILQHETDIHLNILGCDSVSLDEQFPVLWRAMMLLLSRVKQSSTVLWYVRNHSPNKEHDIPEECCCENFRTLRCVQCVAGILHWIDAHMFCFGCLAALRLPVTLLTSCCFLNKDLLWTVSKQCCIIIGVDSLVKWHAYYKKIYLLEELHQFATDWLTDYTEQSVSW